MQELTIFSGKRMRDLTYKTYRAKYFNLFMNNYKIKELSYQQNDYVLRMMWNRGHIACFVNNLAKIFNPKGEGDNKYMALGFADYTGSKWNMYDFVVELTLINPRGVSSQLVPTRTMVVDKDVVIGFAQRSKVSVLQIVNFYLYKIVNLEMLINTQMTIHKMPFLIKITEENKKRMKELVRKLMEDEPLLFGDFTEANLIECITTGATYIMDKLFMLKQDYENELLTYLGVDNMGGSQKKEHLITDEVESNNMLIKDNADNFVDSMREFCERVEKVLGYKLTLECKSEMYQAMMEDGDEDDEDNPEDKKNPKKEEE